MSFFNFSGGAASQSARQPGITGTSLFQPQPQQQQALAMQQQTAGHLQLVIKAGGPATFSTKWEDLTPETQQLLQQVEGRILEYRDESQRLEQCGRLYDAGALKRGFEDEAATVRQLLGGLSVAIRTEQSSLASLFASVKELLAATEMAVRSFLILRHRFARTAALQGGPQQPTLETFYSGIPSLPSPYLSSTVASFEARLAAYRARVEELERLQQPPGAGRDQLEHALPSVLHNVHTFFLHVAAQVESLHATVSSARSAHLAELRRRGEERDPFLEADRREEAQRQAEENRRRAAHPGLMQPQQQQQQAAGIQQPQSTAQQPAAPAPTAGLSLFAPPATSAAAPSLFTPAASSAPSLFGSPTPTLGAGGGNLFATPATGGASAASAATPSFGVGGLFGAATQTPGASSAATPSIFGAPASTPAFGAPTTTPATPTFGGAFGAPATPATPGTAPAFGATAGTAPAWGLGAPPTATRPKPRAARRK